MEPIIIDIENEKYFNADDLKNYDISFFNKTNKTIRDIIKTKKIPHKDHKYCCFNKKENKWKESDKTKLSPKAKLFIKEIWSRKNIPKFNEELKNEYEEVPPELILKDEEKFIDVNNNILKIEVRGEKDCEKCYFKAKDISKEFNILKFESNTISINSGYCENEHYKIFISTNKNTCFTGKNKSKKNNQNLKITSKKIMYLTYLGLTRLLFVSKNANCEHFQKWAVKNLFTIQIGKQEDKQILSHKLLGTSINAVSQTLKMSSSALPAIYLLTLGIVGKLRKTFNISKDILDDTILCKYGRSDDLQRRILEHNNDYGKIKGVELRLVYYAYIDPQIINEAENQLKAHFLSNNMKFYYPNRNELVLINSNSLKNTLKIYDLIGNLSLCSFKDINNKMIELEQKLLMNNIQHEFYIKEKDHEIDKLKIEIKHQNEIIKLKEQIYNINNN